jgi:hypothetical protein
VQIPSNGLQRITNPTAIPFSISLTAISGMEVEALWASGAIDTS